MQVLRCIDEGDVPALHDAVKLWVQDSVGFDLLALAAHLPFPGHGVELSRILDANAGFSSDNAKVREVGFFAMKYVEWRLHFERLVLSPVLEVHSHHEQLPHMDDGKPLSANMHSLCVRFAGCRKMGGRQECLSSCVS